MKSTNITSKNDLTPKQWGRSSWKGLHCITLGYPVNPTDEIKDTYMKFFTLLGKFLPNRQSRINYSLMVLEYNPQYAHIKLTPHVFTNRESLTYWFFQVHEEFNKLLGLTYGMTFDYFLQKYESYRARCESKANPNSGLITKIWGPSLWIMFHSMCYAYPEEPSPNKQTNALNFFKLFGQVLPCIYCRESYAKFILTGLSELTPDTVTSRRKLTLWAFHLHETVNAKLNVNYSVTLVNVDNKYEAARIKNGKYPIYYDNNYCKECPVIPLSLVENFEYYAKKRQEETNLLTDDDFIYINKIKQGIPIIYDNSKCDFWCKRNFECNDIIKKMRIEGIQSLEENGRWKGLPTIYETKLILRLASNLENEVLTDLVTKLPNIKPFTVYKLVLPQNQTPTKITKGCLMPKDTKINSYKYSYLHECSILDVKLCIKFIDYAKSRGIKECEFNFIRAYYKNIELKDKTINIEKILPDRNHECDIIIDYMRQNNIKSIETEGIWKGLPTVEELRLIIRLTSNLSVEQLNNLASLITTKKDINN